MSYLVQIVEQHFTPDVLDSAQAWDPLPVGAWAYSYSFYASEFRGQQTPLFIAEAARPMSKLLAWLVTAKSWSTLVLTRSPADMLRNAAIAQLVQPSAEGWQQDLNIVRCTMPTQLRHELLGLFQGIVVFPQSEDVVETFKRVLDTNLLIGGAEQLMVGAALLNILQRRAAVPLSGSCLHQLLQHFPVIGTVLEQPDYQVLRLYSATKLSGDIYVNLPIVADEHDLDVLVVRDPLRIGNYLVQPYDSTQ